MKSFLLAAALVIGFSGSALSTLEYSIGGLRSHAQESAGARLLRLTQAASGLNEEKIKNIIFEFYNNNRVRKEAKQGYESNWHVTRMLSISSMTLTRASNNLVTANLNYRWEIYDATYYQRSGRGIATIEIMGEAFRVIKFETDGLTFLPID